jgi:[acyl-carrier-protein] S-malonyltransferase
MKNLIFMFPGQGSQSVGMGKDLYEAFPILKETFEEASDVLSLDIKSLCFEDPKNLINQTAYTQPLLLTLEYGIWKILSSNLPIPKNKVALGHSLGEYSALCALGAIPFAKALKMVHYRGQAMQEAVPLGVGGMAAYVGREKNRVIEACKALSHEERTLIEVANYNTPEQIVLSGRKEGLEAIAKIVTEEKLGRLIPLAVSAPFHSSLMRQAQEAMDQYLEDFEFNPFEGLIVANIDGKVHDKTSYQKSYLIKQVSHSVLWTPSVEGLVKDDETRETPSCLWVEVGPGQVLQGLLKKINSKLTTKGMQNLALVTAFMEEMTKG